MDTPQRTPLRYKIEFTGMDEQPATVADHFYIQATNENRLILTFFQYLFPLEGGETDPNVPDEQLPSMKAPVVAKVNMNETLAKRMLEILSNTLDQMKGPEQ